MSKSTVIDPQVMCAVVAAVEACWDEGSPVVGDTPESWQKIAEVAIRRMRSFTRRNVPDEDRASQVRDVAKGLIAAFEQDPKMVGPLTVDYEYVADRVLTVFNQHKAGSA